MPQHAEFIEAEELDIDRTASATCVRSMEISGCFDDEASRPPEDCQWTLADEAWMTTKHPHAPQPPFRAESSSPSLSLEETGELADPVEYEEARALLPSFRTHSA